MASLINTNHLESYPALTESLRNVDLRGKSVLITGGGHGIGAAITRRFTESNVAKIVLVGRTESKLVATINELAAFSTTLTYQVADISSKADVDLLFASLDFSPDILINNAGYMAAPSNFVEANLDDYFQAFKVNVFGTAYMTQAYLRQRGTQSSPGVVLTLNTIGAYSVAVPNLSSYGASKAGLARMMELIAVDVPETTARFISVHPGAVESDMATKSGLDGVFPSTQASLVGDFLVWLSTEAADFLSGRFVWVNWDVEELLQAKSEILEKDLFRTALLSA